ncbi:hydrogenase maturation nickel metallochaperone HypA [uncultured Campylobacter sp.]|uniref:hydrogenase maturation nickel metallochaperone HypA n=1 Tax=uncultured Campylobacter sp. TaxID=218934 RepID=UPI0026236EA1|nr:hydrogenase maturation nickel metallochaperone HypA [uncultured Campylobacter sp.]
MHELSIVQSLVALCEKNAAANSAKEVVHLEVRIGRLSGVEPHYLESAFEVYKTGTICENAELAITLQNVAVECKSCGFIGELSENDFTCPACGSQELEVTGGEDMHLMRLEMR